MKKLHLLALSMILSTSCMILPGYGMNEGYNSSQDTDMVDTEFGSGMNEASNSDSSFGSGMNEASNSDSSPSAKTKCKQKQRKESSNRRRNGEQKERRHNDYQHGKRHQDSNGGSSDSQD